MTMSAARKHQNRSLFQRIFYPPAGSGFYATFMEYFRIIGGALLLATVFRSFVASPYKIPSSSMVPTLLVGDYLFVSKFSYGLRVPLTDIFFFESAPARGDIVVFRADVGGTGVNNYIKRVVAVPGDRIAYHDKQMYLNGAPVALEPAGEYVYSDDGAPVFARRYVENLGGVQHWAMLQDTPGMEVEETLVPEGKFVMVGDNRDNSYDSRAWQHPNWGFVPRSAIVGRAEFIFWSWNRRFVPRFDRLFSTLRHEYWSGQGN